MYSVHRTLHGPRNSNRDDIDRNAASILPGGRRTHLPALREARRQRRHQ